VQVKGARTRIPEEASIEGEDLVTVMVHHQEARGLPSPVLPSPYRGEQPSPYLGEEGSEGSQSPPLDCTGASLITAEPRHTM